MVEVHRACARNKMTSHAQLTKIPQLIGNDEIIILLSETKQIGELFQVSLRLIPHCVRINKEHKNCTTNYLNGKRVTSKLLKLFFYFRGEETLINFIIITLEIF